MTLKSKLIKNVSFTLIAEIVSKVLSFITIIVIARVLGESGLGVYSYIFSFGFFFIIFSNFGIRRYIAREIARDKSKNKRYFDNGITLKISLSIILIIINFIIAYFISLDKSVLISSVLAMIILSLEGIDLDLHNVFTAYEELKYRSIMILLERSFSCIIGIIVLLILKNLHLFLLVFLVSRVIIILIEYKVISKRYFRLGLSWDFNFWFFLIKKSLSFWFTRLFEVIYTRTDVLMLTYLTTFEIVGQYSAASKIIEALIFIPAAITITIYPTMSRIFSDSKKVLKIIFEKSFHYVLTLALPIAVLIYSFSGFIINTMYGEVFSDSIIILKIFAWSGFLTFLISILGISLNAINKQKIFSISVGLAAFTNIILNLILIKKYQHVGAAISTLITQLVCFAALYVIAKKEKLNVNLKMALKIVVSGCFMIGIISLLNARPIAIPIAAAVYFIILYLMGGIYKEEKQNIKQILNTIKGFP